MLRSLEHPNVLRFIGVLYKDKTLSLVTGLFVVSGLPVVLKFLKFYNCPEIRNCPEILLIWSECPEIDLCYAVVTALPLFCTLLI